MMFGVEDGCFERFGTNKTQCMASAGRCEWLELDGQGKCVTPRREHEGKHGAEHGGKREDGCFEQFGTNKTRCMESAGRCEWLELDGQGKCVMPRREHESKHGAEHGGKRTDRCFERFGTNKTTCMEAEDKCEWLEHDGRGKCVMSRHGGKHKAEHGGKHEDSCFELFGTNKMQCMESESRCEWLEGDGRGKCVMPRREHEGKHRAEHGGKREDGCFERFGTNKTQCMESQGKCEWLE